MLILHSPLYQMTLGFGAPVTLQGICIVSSAIIVVLAGLLTIAGGEPVYGREYISQKHY